ncbi:hypothetical protein TBLA_0A07390 [Henningerozyma blattae CBS 6284]|uniref:Protein PBN1 n=1 Tax=Henningerozyma blattae (strain ATCC 34711 / CBS 6284 / DSM 70876 / NBRC 10599 / NRRL Y-10934 / UCD 77-7) TaxID=1071380 RepID=I2GWM7_HENB6|nr:hypothetical protein TBLA_0A07390 [Tetrapisispora blattae CBS 6284]CCH58529.1 hypothetical protein TBLA_0A07390 [Tetrapisispora blattae CBS 6284]
MRERLTVFFNSPEEINSLLKLDVNSTISVSKSESPLILQKRFIFDDIQLPDAPFRLIYNQGNLLQNSPILPTYPYGCSVFTSSNSTDDSKLVKVPDLYSSFHSMDQSCINRIPSLDGFEFNTKSIYDITYANEALTIIEYSLINDLDYTPEVHLEKAEIGLFYTDDTENSLINNLSGLRCVFDTETSSFKRCQKTMLSYNSNQYIDSNHQVSIELENPVGLHPKLLFNTSNITLLDNDNCNLYTYIQLNNTLFCDPFQSISEMKLFGQYDLELPSYSTEIQNGPWGSELLLQLNSALDINELVLHSRYGLPDSSYKQIVSPLVFQACSTKEDQLSFENPFYENGYSYQKWFNNDSIFIHYNSIGEALEFEIPTANSRDYNSVTIITASCLILSLFYLLRKLFM